MTSSLLDPTADFNEDENSAGPCKKSSSEECTSVSNTEEVWMDAKFFNSLTAVQRNSRQLNIQNTTSDDDLSDECSIIVESRQGTDVESDKGTRIDNGSEDTTISREPEQQDSSHYLFLVISCGYMLPWTSLGSLISYYKATYGASFYVKLYCAYYLPGLPIAMLQYRYDNYVDSIFSSQWTYLFRGLTSYMIMIGILISMIFIKSEATLILLFSVLGFCAWLSHGTSSILASMYPHSAIVNLQTGVRCPEILTVVAVSILHLGRKASRENLTIFYILNCAFISISTISWIYILTSSSCRYYLSLKDNPQDTKELHDYQSLRREEIIMNEKNKSKVMRMNDLRKNLLEEEQNSLTSVFYQRCKLDVSDKNSNCYQERNNNNNDSSTNNNNNNYVNSFNNSIKESSNGDDTEKQREAQERVRMWPLRAALFIVMFFSILQAPFFAYVTSPVKGRNIEQILYFVRLFSDLLGRPLTRMFRSALLVSNNQILTAACCRIMFVVLFFGYILSPTIPRSDAFVISVVALFSVSSGYLTVLIYEFASVGQDKRTQATATALLNLSFQGASFCAVCISLAVTSSAQFDEYLKS